MDNRIKRQQKNKWRKKEEADAKKQLRKLDGHVC
jgi:hypothetical protein